MADEIEARYHESARLLIRTRISCFPEAPLEKVNFTIINGLNYHDQFLALYLGNELESHDDIGYVGVWANNKNYIDGKNGTYSIKLVFNEKTSEYEYSSKTPRITIRSLSGNSDPKIVISTTNLEFKAALESYKKRKIPYYVMDRFTECLK